MEAAALIAIGGALMVAGFLIASGGAISLIFVGGVVLGIGTAKALW